MARDVKIKVESVCKIFGKTPQEPMAKVCAGMGKADLLAQTSHVLGLNDISPDIAKGELFVIMGLSG